MGKIKNIFVVVVLFWILRMVLPGVKYVFIPLFFLFLLLLFINERKIFLKKNFIIEFLKANNPLLVLGLFYLIGILITGKLYQINLRDLFEFIISLVLLFGYFIIIHKSNNPKAFSIIFRNILKLIAFASIFVATIGIIKFVLQLNNIGFAVHSPLGTSINSDKNFYALFSLLGLVGMIPWIQKKQPYSKSFLIQIGILLLLFNVIFSLSYRAGLIILILILVLIIINFQYYFLKSSIKVNNIVSHTRGVLISIILLFMLYMKCDKTNLNILKITQENIAAFKENPDKIMIEAFNFDKWQYAFDKFMNQRWYNKLFGMGFDYLEDFGNKFYPKINRFDYPHNPILSALLYSGLLGAFFTFVFIVISVYYGIIYFKNYPLFSLMLYISFLFIFFSGNSLFSVPIFLFLFSLSFLIRYKEITGMLIDNNFEKPGSRFLKESFDYIASSVLFIILLPLLILLSISVIISLGWPIIYSQRRVGQNGKLFYLHKFRTMNNATSDTSVAAVESFRISKLGMFLRRFKLDELPELWNIMQGDMSFVGPRPDVSGYADKLDGQNKNILKLKPGLTGAATLKYVDEELLLSKMPDPQRHNDEVIFPDKVKINMAYMKYWSFWLDIKIIIFTLLRKPLNEKYFQ